MIPFATLVVAPGTQVQIKRRRTNTEPDVHTTINKDTVFEVIHRDTPEDPELEQLRATVALLNAAIEGFQRTIMELEAELEKCRNPDDPPPPPPPPPLPVPGTRIPPDSAITAFDGALWTLVSGIPHRDSTPMTWGTCLALKRVGDALWVQGDSTVWYQIVGTSLGYSQPNEPGDAPPPAPAPEPPPAPPPPAPVPPPPPAPAPPPTGAQDFSTLQPGTARLVGSWMEDPASTEPTEINVQAPNQRTDWGSMCYSAKHDALFMQGGHHGLHLTTSPRKLQPHLGVYRNLAPTVPISEMTAANCDSNLGRWISHNAPWSRHTFQSMVAVGDYVGCLLGQNSHNAVNGFQPAPGDGRPYFWNLLDQNPLTACEFVMTAAGWHSHWMGAVGISDRYAIACYVPESNWLQCWVYDHQTKTKRQVPMQIDTVGWPGAINVCFDGTACYAVGPFGKVFKLLIDPVTATGTCEQLSAGWAPLPGDSDVRVDYGAANHALGGCLKNGKYRSFDLTTRTWGEVTLQVESGSSGVPHQSFWASAFDTKRGVYFAANNRGELWAVRPPSSGTSTPPAPPPAPVPDPDPEPEPAPAPAPPAGDHGLTAELDFGNGQVARFAGGEDIGTFVGEFVRQRCFLALDPAHPDWRVLFRPDSDGKRDEVVVEYGRAIGGTAINRMQPYTATIRKAATVVHTVTVPTHWWNARWRWQSAPRPLVRTPEQLIERGWIPKLGTAGLFNRAPYTFEAAHEGPMTLPAHMSTSMGSAGENQMIGHLTESAAEYVIRRQPNHIVTSRVEAEACATWQTHLRLADGALPDIAAGLHYVGTGVPNSVLNQARNVAHPDEVAEADSHWWPCANLPWLLTEDPYLLEEVQFGANWRLLANSSARVGYGLGGIAIQQPRTWGWFIRDAALLAATTPEFTPRWLQPRSTWKRVLDDNLAFAMRHVNSSSAMCQTFKIWLNFRYVACWMNSFINAAIGQAVKMGFTEWLPAFRWGTQQHIDQISGTSGWAPQNPTPYLWHPLNYGPRDDLGANGWPVTPNPELEAVAFKTWKEASDALIADKYPGQDPATWDDKPRLIGQSYALQVRAALVLAVEHGVPDAQLCLDKLEGYIRDLGWDGMARFAIVP